MVTPTALMILTGVIIGIHGIIGTDGIVGTGGVDGTPGMIHSGVLTREFTTTHSLDGETRGRFHLDSETDGDGATHGTDTICMIPFIVHFMQVVSTIHGSEALAHLTEVGAGEIPTIMDIITDFTTATIMACHTMTVTPEM